MNWREIEEVKNMFFGNILVKDKVLRKVWRAGNNMSERSDENTSLPTICSKLDRWVRSESMDASQRLSLRTSSILIDGAAKLYKKEMEQMFEDVALLDEEMILRNKRDATDFEEETSTSTCCETPELMMRRAEVQPDISFEAPTSIHPDPTISPPILHRGHSIITSTPSPSKRQREEMIFISPKRRFTNSDHSRETTPYPCSKSSGSDHTESSLESSDRPSDHEKSSRSRKESESDDSLSVSQASKSSESLRAQRSSNSQNLTPDQATVKNTVLETARNSEISSHVESKSLSQETDKRSRSSPTFTEIFDIVANLPNERDTETDKNISHSDTGKETDRFDKIAAQETDRNEKSPDVVDMEKSPDYTAMEHDQGSHVSERSIILMTTKKPKQKLRRTKKSSRPNKILKDQAAQVDSFHPRTDERDNQSNERLPFGYLLIHDSNSRFPSKIVISSLRENINNLV